MNWTRGWWWLSRWVLVLWGDIIRNVLVGLLLGRLGETILGRGGSSAPLDHPHTKHARDALWRHLPNRCSGLLLKVGPELFGRALLGALVETGRDTRPRATPVYSEGCAQLLSHDHVASSCLALFASPMPCRLRVTHLHRTEWKNIEYRKRDFLIRCGSDNVGIYGI
ncbi:hypothetical protein GOBAR_AA10472 [Gossypium barbadense]|uniref:Uncharacterized protein n=1 Tax=Gossypium barbadense TaxID=3634 RepID=A0A2P5Y3I6_GOSBA|nr:hypothetical protein GOBAR_AA10472 [Gossypium barbadense]